MAVTRFGLFISPSYGGVTPDQLFAHMRGLAQAAESSGFDSLWLPDHLMQSAIGGGRTGVMPEAYTMLAALAATTSTARLGTTVTPVTMRAPALLAKMVTTIDLISGGRAVLGLGAGWDAEEFGSYGIEFPAAGEREDRLAEAIRICRAMFDEQAASFSGLHYAIEHAYNVPRPQGGIPILVGGGGERRTLRIVAELADACNVSGDPEQVRHKFEVLGAHCATVGRELGAITKTCTVAFPESAGQLVDEVGARLAVGADGVIVMARTTADQVAVWGAALAAEFGA
jgi:F420-dependent oxidoreductase-like protein